MVNKRLSDKATSPAQRLIILILVMLLIMILVASPISRIRTLLVLKKPMHISSIIESKKGLELKRPIGLAANEKNIFVTDVSAAKVNVYDIKGNYEFSFGEDELKVPVYITVDSEESIYVTDRSRKEVLKFDKDGRFIGPFGSKHLKNPLGIASDKEGNIYVTDIGKEHTVVILEQNGTLINSFGKKGKAYKTKEDDGYFYYPNDIAIQNDGNQAFRVYVADSNNQRVQVFDKDGGFKAIIDTGGLPRGIAFNDKLKTLFVVDGLGHKINAYDENGKVKFTFSKQGSNEGDLKYPSDIALVGKNQDDIYVTDRMNKRIQLFSAVITPERVRKILRPYAKFLPLPFLLLLLLFVASRRKKYIISDCFINELLTSHKVDDFLKEKRLFSVTPFVNDFLSQENLMQNFGQRLKLSKRVDKKLVAKIKEKYGLDESHAEQLAVAYKRGIYQPVLCVCDNKVSKAAKEMGIEVLSVAGFFGEDEGHH